VCAARGYECGGVDPQLIKMNRSFPLAELPIFSWKPSVLRRCRSLRLLPGHSSLCPPHTRRMRGGFTLLEMLVVVVIMAVMMGLMGPAVRGLVGVSGKRGGMNTLSSVIEQARLTAMQSGAATYVGFPFGVSDPELGYSSVIVVRAAVDGEAPGLKPVSRWMKMPSGVYIESDDLPRSLPAGGDVPTLGGQSVASLAALEFDRFGKLRPDDTPVVIRVGEKAGPEPSDPFLVGPNNHFELTVQPLTGRTMVVDRSTNLP
jgi:prepilin-type N-terminal cleavage/methylation domain-containing protein